MSLYKGYAQQRVFSANQIKIPDPSDKIRTQGLQQLKYMQDELDAKNKQAHDLQEVFNQNIQLEQKVSDYQEKLKKLQEDLQILKISKSVNISKEELKHNRQKINKYVREIDRCIELLNK